MDFVKFLVAIKVEKISLPAVITLTTLAKVSTKEDPFMYIGEAHAYFHEEAKTLGLKNAAQWSYGAVGRMLNVVTSRGLVTKEKDGRYVKFCINENGKALLERLYPTDTPSTSETKLRLVN